MTIITKILSVLISFIMAISSAAVPTEKNTQTDGKTASENYPYTLEDMSVVYDQKDENGNYYPLVVVPGISHSITYVVDKNYDYDKAEDKSKPPIAKDERGNDLTGSTVIFDVPSIIKAAAEYVIYPLIKSIITQTDCGLTEGVGKLADVAFSVQQTNPDGTFANNDIGLLKFNGSFADYADKDGKQDYMENQCAYLYKILPLHAVADIIGEDKLFFYTFSLFGDPMSAADDLNDYIDMVLKETGAKKVNLLPISLGGTVFTAFCDSYTNTDKVNAVVNIVPVLNGTQVVTDTFNRDFDVSSDMWYQELFPLAIGEFSEYGEIIGHSVNLLLRALPAKVNAAMLTEVYNVLFDHLFQNTPQIWAMVNRESYPALAEKFLSDSAHAAVKAKTDAFYHAQTNLEDNIKTMTSNGISINIICGYNLHSGDVRYKFFHIMGNSNNVNGDGVINIQSSSLGATASLPGTTLGDNYVQSVSSDYSYISPDKEIDASTGVLPDNTWYFYNMHHEDAANNSPVINLAIALMYSSDVTDVHTNPKKYPQFNGNSDNWFIRRWRYTNIKELYKQYQNGELKWSADTVKECEDIMYDCERVMRATIADSAFCKETTYRLNVFLNKYGSLKAENVNILTQKQLNELPDYLKVLEKVLAFVDNSLYKVFSDKAYSEFWKLYFE
jgi:pimeloyl-ACP methyl ester carboxylesterase